MDDAEFGASQRPARGRNRGALRLAAEGGRRTRRFAQRRQPADRPHGGADRPDGVRAHVAPGSRRPLSDASSRRGFPPASANWRGGRRWPSGQRPGARGVGRAGLCFAMAGAAAVAALHRHPEVFLRIDASTKLVDLDHSDVDIAIRLGDGNWPGATGRTADCPGDFSGLRAGDGRRAEDARRSGKDLGDHRRELDVLVGQWFKAAGVEPVTMLPGARSPTRCCASIRRSPAMA